MLQLISLGQNAHIFEEVLDFQLDRWLGSSGNRAKLIQQIDLGKIIINQ